MNIDDIIKAVKDLPKPCVGMTLNWKTWDWVTKLPTGVAPKHPLPDLLVGCLNYFRGIEVIVDPTQEKSFIPFYDREEFEQARQRVDGLFRFKPIYGVNPLPSLGDGLTT